MSSEHGEASEAIEGTEANTSRLDRNTAEVQLSHEQQRHRSSIDGDAAIGKDDLANNFRRYSLPTSTGSISLLSSPLVGGDYLALVQDLAPEAPSSSSTQPDSQQHQQQQQDQEQQQPAPLTPRNPNKTNYGHRSTKSNQTLPDQPVLVRSYSQNNMNPAIEEQSEESERVELPPIEAFSFDGILKSIDPKVSRTVETITQLSSGYRANLTHETDLLIEAQKSIDSQIIHADRLSNQVLKTTNARSDKLKTEAAPFKNGTAVEELAQSAESAYAMVENIIATLQAIDQMLPAQDQLSTDDSPHKFHYPYTHSLLAVKAAEVRRRQASSESRLNPRHSASYSPASSSSSSRPPIGAGSSSARVLSPTSQIPITGRSHHRQSPLIQYNYPPLSVQQRKMSSPPNMQLRTIMPSPSPDSPKPPVAVPTVASPSPSSNKALPASASVAAADRDSRSLLSASLGGAAPSTRSSFSFKNILWGGNWGRGSRSSVGAVSSHGGSQVGGESAEDRLRRIMEAQAAKAKGADTRP